MARWTPAPLGAKAGTATYLQWPRSIASGQRCTLRLNHRYIKNDFRN
jgi:hypothetical protein